jgi:hypothetical protein
MEERFQEIIWAWIDRSTGFPILTFCKSIHEWPKTEGCEIAEYRLTNKGKLSHHCDTEKKMEKEET